MANSPDKNSFNNSSPVELNQDLTIKNLILSKNERRFKSLFKNMRQGIIILSFNKDFQNPIYIINDINDYFLLLSCLSKNFLVGKDLDFTVKNYENELLTVINNHLLSHSSNAIIYHLKNTDKYVELFSYNVSDSETIISICNVTVNYKKLIAQKKQSWEIVTAMGSLVEKRDMYTSNHQKKVAVLAAQIASELKLSKSLIESVFIAGMLHDIGKITVPSEILTKPGKLLDIEYSLMKTHVDTSFEILKEINFDWPIAKIISQHHETLDGGGYPLGLLNEDICLESKILTVADVYDAITSHRPYRPSLGVPFAEKHLSELAGIKYDSSVVDACIKVTENLLWHEYDIENILGVNYFTKHFKTKA